jgi:hypothetical protein
MRSLIQDLINGSGQTVWIPVETHTEYTAFIDCYVYIPFMIISIFYGLQQKFPDFFLRCLS